MTKRIKEKKVKFVGSPIFGGDIITQHGQDMRAYVNETVIVPIPKRYQEKVGPYQQFMFHETVLPTAIFPDGSRVTVAAIYSALLGTVTFAASVCAPDDEFDANRAIAMTRGRARAEMFPQYAALMHKEPFVCNDVLAGNAESPYVLRETGFPNLQELSDMALPIYERAHDNAAKRRTAKTPFASDDISFRGTVDMQSVSDLMKQLFGPDAKIVSVDTEMFPAKA